MTPASRFLGPAERLAGVGPVFAAISAVTPVGPAALWGGLADSIGGRSLWLAQLIDLHRGDVWSEAQALTDRVAALQPRLRQRPPPFPVVHRNGEELFPPHRRSTPSPAEPRWR